MIRDLYFSKCSIIYTRLINFPHILTFDLTEVSVQCFKLNYECVGSLFSVLGELEEKSRELSNLLRGLVGGVGQELL